MLEQLLDDNFGVVRRSQLMACGMSQTELNRLVRDKELRRLRPGWYAGGSSDQAAMRAVLSGGVLSCLSALSLRGVWIPLPGEVHVRRSTRPAQRPPSWRRDCRLSRRRVLPLTHSVDSVDTALACVVATHHPDTAVAAMDAALRLRRVERQRLAVLCEESRWPGLDLLGMVNPEAASIPESYVRLRLARRGIKPRVNVHIAGFGRVGLMVGDRLVIETDRWRGAAAPAELAEGRRRDEGLRLLGYTVARLSFDDVMRRWALTEMGILGLLRSQHHRWPARLTSHDAQR